MMNDVQGRIAYKFALAKGQSNDEALVYANTKSRDKSRSPMQWDGGEFSGFSSVKPWLGILEEFKYINVESQRKDSESLYHYYKKLIELRERYDVFAYGDYRLISKDASIISFVRYYDGESVYVILNVEDVEVEINVPAQFNEVIFSSKRNIGMIDLDSIAVLSHEAIILRSCRL